MATLGAILQMIQKNGSLTRTEIAKQTGLSKSTVTIYIDKLLASDLLKEEQIVKESENAKRTTVEINEKFGWVLGIDLGNTSVDIGLCNFSAEIKDSIYEPINLNLGPEAVFRKVFSLSEVLLSRNSLKLDSLRGVGMGIPGGVDLPSGVLIAPPEMPGWIQMNVQKYLEEHFKCLVYIDNDVNVMAAGEKKAGIAENHKDFIFIKIGTGIGSGIVANDQLYHGATASEGDIGHIGFDGEDAMCRCGHKGCLEVIAAGPAIARAGYNLAIEGKSEVLSKILAETGKISCEDVGVAVHHGD